MNMLKKNNGKNILLTFASISILGNLGGCASLPSPTTTFNKTYTFNYSDNYGAKGRACQEPDMARPDSESYCNISSYIKNGQSFKYKDRSDARVVSLATNSDGKSFNRVNRLLLQYPSYSSDKAEAQVQVTNYLFLYEKDYNQGGNKWVADVGFKSAYGCNYTNPNPNRRSCSQGMPAVIKLKKDQKVAFSIFDIEYFGNETWRITVPSDGKTTGESPDNVICGKGIKDCRALH
jgi:hypothetical protein